MEKILVTGSAGFIGMHTILKLLRDGYEVIGLDNINDYYDVNLKLERLKKQGIKKEEISYNSISKGLENLRFIKLNIEDKENLQELFAQEKFDYVIHLAAQAGVRYSIENPEAYISSNIIGFFNILEVCRSFPVKHLLYASSSSVYGLNSNVPFKESDITDHPVSLYAASKKSNEMMAHSYAYLYQIPVTGLRFFTVYGPWGRPDMALFLFTKKILADEAIDVYNNGDMFRDFTFVDDIINGIVKVMNKPPVGKTKSKEIELASDESIAEYRILNIGNSKPVNLKEFILQLEKKLGRKAKMNFMPMQPGDVYYTYANTRKLQEEVVYTPSVSIEEGISKFADWYKEYYKVNI